MRKSKIVSITLHPDILIQIDDLKSQNKQNRSEIIKNIINAYFKGQKTLDISDRYKIRPQSLSQLLKMYYDLSSKQKQKNHIIGLGIIINKGKVLIGKRKGLDPYVKHLSWVFPGGMMHSLNFEKELIVYIKHETGFTVKVERIVHARIHPDNINDKVKIIALYFHCSIVSGKQKAGGYKKFVPLIKLKWVQPTAVVRYFTTSTADEVMNFLKRIEFGI